MPTFLFPWSRLSVANRLGWGFGLLLVALVGVGAAGMLALNEARREADAVESLWQTRVLAAQELQVGAGQIAAQAQALNLALGLMPGPTDGPAPGGVAEGAPAARPLAVAQAVRLLVEQRGRTLELEARLREAEWNPSGRAAVDAAIAAGATVRPVIDELVRAATEPQARGAQALASRQLVAVDGPWRQQLRRLAELTQGQREAALRAAATRQSRALAWLAGLTGLCLLGGVCLAVALVSSVRRPIDVALRLAERLVPRPAAEPGAEGRGQRAGGDELARLQLAMTRLQHRLRERRQAAAAEGRAAHGSHTPVDLTSPVTPSGVPDGANPTGPAARAAHAPKAAPTSGSASHPAPVHAPEPAVGPAPTAPAPATGAPVWLSTEPADGALAGASSGSDWVDTGAVPAPTPMRSMPVSAEVLVHDAVRVAERGSDVVTKVVSNMEDISASSRKINEILATIDSIAFQTNILALNAAVQAARAGQAGPEGRGFGVVAGEVRGLAQRAASAAREIKGLIHASVEKAESGTRLVRDAGTTMDAIVSSVQSVTELVGQISHQAGEQQAETLAAADRSVQRLDHLTRQNAALVEHSASAADALRQQADRLEKVVGAFKLLQQTQEAAWTAHTAIHSARTTSRGDTHPGGLDPLGGPSAKRPPAEGEPGSGWEGF